MRAFRQALLLHWPAGERNALIGASLALFGSFLLNATWGVIILPVQQTFGLGVDGEVLLRQLPDIAGLIAVPLVGALGAGVSAFRLAAISAACVLSGALLMTLAPAIGWLVIGMGAVSIGRSVVSVLAFSVVAASIADTGRRTSGFATLGAVAPTAYIIAPVLAGWLLGMGDWRWVGAVWIASGLILLASMRWFRGEPAGPTSVARKEPWTPILAGVTLVGIVQTLGAVSLHGVLSFHALALVAGTVAAAAIWFGLVRVLPNPSLDGTTLRTPGLLPILLVAMVAQCGDLWFYVGAVVRFVHRLTSLEVSLALLAAQIASLAGAGVAGWLIRRIGIRHAGALLIGWFAASMWLSCTQTISSPLWVTVSVLAVSAVAEIGSGVCVTQAIMSSAPEGLDRQVSSCRSAATGVGNALALLLVASTVSQAMGASTRRHAVESGGTTPEQVEALVEAVEDNKPTGTIIRELGLSPDRLEQLREVRREIIMDGFRAHGVVSGTVLSIAAVGFWLVCRPSKCDGAAGRQS